MPRIIRRSTAPVETVEDPTPVTLEDARAFSRDTVLERAEGATQYRVCIAVWDQADAHGDTFTRGSIDLTIPAAGIPLLVGHRRSDDPVGGVAELLNEDDGCYAVVEFASTARGREVETLVREGFYRAVSFAGTGSQGYERGDGVFVYTAAKVAELSITAFPADAGAVFDQIARSVGDVDGVVTVAVTTPDPDPSDVETPVVEDPPVERTDAVFDLDSIADLVRTAVADALAASVSVEEIAEPADVPATVPDVRTAASWLDLI